MRYRSCLWSVIAGLLISAIGMGCQSTPIMQADHERTAVRVVPEPIVQRTVMSAGSLNSALAGVSTIGFASPNLELSHESDASDAQREHGQLETAVRGALRSLFDEAGYIWEEEKAPDRVLDVAWFLEPEAGMTELDRLYDVMPGFLEAEQLQRGVIAVSISWPGRAEPVYRASIEGVGRLDWPMKIRLERIPEAVGMLLGEIPPGSVVPAQSVAPTVLD